MFIYLSVLTTSLSHHTPCSSAHFAIAFHLKIEKLLTPNILYQFQIHIFGFWGELGDKTCTPLLVPKAGDLYKQFNL